MNIKHNLIIILFGCLLLSNQKTSACDLCGCGNGGSFWGIMPQSHRAFIGLRYGQKSYDSHFNSPNTQTHEDFWKTELWARVFPFKKVQVLAFIPYNFNRQTIIKTGKILDLRGIGDVSTFVHYNLLNTITDTIPHKFYHNLLIGGGVKLPTGKYDYDLYSDVEVANPNFQLGTGSTDFMVNIVYTLKYKAWGLNYDFSYKINTQNSNEYRFGNRINTNLSALYFVGIGSNITLIPNIGLAYESSELDEKFGIRNSTTGGDVLMGSLGIEGYFKKISMGVNYQKPISQHLSNGELRANNHLNLHFTLMI
ncbi:MAG: hypothetical protein RLZZ306_2093 [Bacteroidota bacterium]|jgi:hypothetical protein